MYTPLNCVQCIILFIYYVNYFQRSSKTFNGLVNSILLNTAFAQSQKRLQIQIPTDTIKQSAGKPSNEKHFNKGNSLTFTLEIIIIFFLQTRSDIKNLLFRK